MKKAISILISALACVAASAQGGSFLLYNSEAANMATAQFALEHIPALEALSGKAMDISASYGIWAPEDAGTSMISLNGYGNTGKVSIGLQGRYNLGQDYTLTSSQAKPMGYFTPVDFALGLTFAYRISDCFALGAKAAYIYSSIGPEAQGSTASFDLSAAYKKGEFEAIFALKNLGPALKFSSTGCKLPTIAALGGRWQRGGFAALAEASCLFSGHFLAGIGAEYTFAEIVSLRAGYHFASTSTASSVKIYAPVPSYFSAGLGVTYRGAKFSAAYIPRTSSTSSAALFTLSYSF